MAVRIKRSRKWSKKSTKAKSSARIYGKKRKMNVQQIVKRELNKNLETKCAVTTSTDGVEILHNNFITLDNTVLATTQGVKDQNSVPNGNNTVRIGDEITLKGVSMKMMFELNERYSDVTIRIMLVRSARGDVPTRTTFFNGLSGNKMLDTTNRERYTIILDKWIKMKAPNYGSIGTHGIVSEFPGNVPATDADQVLSRATRIVKLWVPGAKFAKNGKIRYEGESAQQKFFDYHVLAYAYSNYGTAQDIYNVARLNDYIKVLYFKDG